MAEIRKRKTRMYEPWGYQDQNNYESSEIIQENDLDSFFADVNYNKDDNKIYFYNKDGEKIGTLDVSEFVKSDSIIDKVEYKDGILTIIFTNGDEIHIDLTELIDENEFKDGLIVDGHVVKVLVDDESEKWLTVSENGIKVSGIQSEIDRLDDRVDSEISRATAEEERIESKLDKEIQDRINNVDAEENRAKAAEQVLTTNLANEITRATQTEQQLNSRISSLNDELDAEESTRESNDAALSLRITTEVNDRIAAVNAEKARAEAAEATLNDKIDAEISNREATDSVISGAVDNLSNDLAIEVQRAKDEEETLNERIDEIISGTPIEQLDELIDKLGYKDNDTLQTTNEHEVAFGEWNVSNTSAEPSGQTVFSVGIGTSAHDRKNALEVRKDGSIWATVEGEYLDITKILGQLTHEVYDADTNGNH